MSGNDHVLAVYLGKMLIAHLSLQQEHLVWHYTKSWQTTGFAVSPHLPLVADIPAININRFFRNMLPEGQAFEELLQNVHVSRNNTFALVQALGLDIPGALVLAEPKMELPTEGSLRWLTDEELSNRLDKRDVSSLIIWDNKPRLSVAGVQDKINLLIYSTGRMGFGEGSLCSTHILKFERQTQTNLVVNQYFTLQLAKSCGLNVANATLKRYGKHVALLVERFDRKLINDKEIKRKHIIDGCQALNLPPEYKYEKNFGSGRDVAHIREGASLPLLFNFANYCHNPILTKQQILDWVLFNIIVYNLDAHGKNISFYVSSQGMALTPFYDLVNVKLFPDVDQDFAMGLGDEFNSNNVNAYQIADFAESCQLPRRYVENRLLQMIKTMMIVLPQEIAKINNEFGYGSYFAEYEQVVMRRVKHLLKESKKIAAIVL